MKIQDPNQSITFVNGKGLSPNIEILCYLFLGIPIILAFSDPIAGIFLSIVFLPIGLIPFFTKWGTEIQLTSKNYRHFRSIYGLSLGQWKSYGHCSDIVIQTNRYTGLAQSRTGVTTEVHDMKTEVFFMTPNHLSKIHIAVAENILEARQIANDLATKTQMEVKPFSPPKMTRRRR